MITVKYTYITYKDRYNDIIERPYNVEPYDGCKEVSREQRVTEYTEEEALREYNAIKERDFYLEMKDHWDRSDYSWSYYFHAIMKQIADQLG